MSARRPYVISIAGFDPSGGAGLLADGKTFEQQGVYGLGVCTALTVQNDQAFFSLRWQPLAFLLEQLTPLFDRFSIAACKIGLIESLEVLMAVVQWLREKNDRLPIVWDPVLKASAGYAFHDQLHAPHLQTILQTINLVTPNYNEWQSLEKVTGNLLTAGHCAVLLKGGHNPELPGTDLLYENGHSTVIPAGMQAVYAKHGSGCVLSAAITARLAKGQSLAAACTSAKQYAEQFLNSNETLLGYHNI